MLVHKGGKIKNWGGECRDVTPTVSKYQGRCEQRSEVLGKIQKKNYFFFFFWGGGGGQVRGGMFGGGGHRVDVNKELKFL